MFNCFIVDQSSSDMSSRFKSRQKNIKKVNKKLVLLCIFIDKRKYHRFVLFCFFDAVSTILE